MGRRKRYFRLFFGFETSFLDHESMPRTFAAYVNFTLYNAIPVTQQHTESFKMSSITHLFSLYNDIPITQQLFQVACSSLRYPPFSPLQRYPSRSVNKRSILTS